ncbi:MAG TPA: hypothetical protein VJY39_11590 [Acidisphaera sp.]|nr:hypothetical protein [Acidisphaera sp.]
MARRSTRVVILLVALTAGAFAFVRTRALFQGGTHPGADYFCYELRQGWVCTYAEQECRLRQANEAPPDVQRGCTAHDDDVLTP